MYPSMKYPSYRRDIEGRRYSYGFPYSPYSWWTNWWETYTNCEWRRIWPLLCTEQDWKWRAEPCSHLHRAQQRANDGSIYTENGVQLYTGNWLGGFEGAHGATFPARSAVCFEAQCFPDTPNKSHFPSAVLLPGEVSTSKLTIYKFGVQEWNN